MLAKLGGVWAPKPSAGPHKRRECLPLIIFLRNRLKYALNRREVTSICKQRLIKVDNKVRTDIKYPSGFMDVISIEKTNEFFRLLYDTKGRFIVHRITPEEAKFKLAKVRTVRLGLKGVPYITTSDGCTFRYPDPLIKVSDTVKIDLTTGKIIDFLKFEIGSLAMVTSGSNLGRVGVIEHKERHLGGFDIVHLKDAAGQKFATRWSNVFVIGKTVPVITLPKHKGVRMTIIRERELRLKKQKESKAARARKNKKKRALLAVSNPAAVKKSSQKTATAAKIRPTKGKPSKPAKVKVAKK